MINDNSERQRLEKNALFGRRYGQLNKPKFPQREPKFSPPLEQTSFYARASESETVEPIDLEPESCECDYPHGSDFDAMNFERCTCKAGCVHDSSIDLDDIDLDRCDACGGTSNLWYKPSGAVAYPFIPDTVRCGSCIGKARS